MRIGHPVGVAGGGQGGAVAGADHSGQAGKTVVVVIGGMAVEIPGPGDHAEAYRHGGA